MAEKVRRGKGFRDVIRESNPELGEFLERARGDLTPVTDFRAMSERLTDIAGMAMAIASSQTTMEGMFLRMDGKVSRLEEKVAERHSCVRGDVLEHLLESSRDHSAMLEKTIRLGAVKEERIKRLEEESKGRDSRRHGLLIWIASLTASVVVATSGYVWYFGGLNNRVETLERDTSSVSSEFRSFREGSFSKAADSAREAWSLSEGHASRLTMIESDVAGIRDRLSQHLERHPRR